MTLQQIESKLALFRRNLDQLAKLPHESLEVFLADDRNLPAALHLLQTAIQALIDIGSYATARLGLAAPARSRDVLETLEHAGRLPPGAAARFGPMFSFRNRIVHLYDRVDAAIAHRLVAEQTDDLRELLDLLLGALEAEAE